MCKIISTKAGQFVIFYQREYRNSETKPFDDSNNIDIFIVSISFKGSWGQFIFPKLALIQYGIISVNQKCGKKAFRVYLSKTLEKFSYSCHRFKKDLHITYKSLYEQFGTESTQKHFNSNIKKALKQVCQFLPNIYIKVDTIRNKEKGLLLLDISRPAIDIQPAETLKIQEEQK